MAVELLAGLEFGPAVSGLVAALSVSVGLSGALGSGLRLGAGAGVETVSPAPAPSACTSACGQWGSDTGQCARPSQHRGTVEGGQRLGPLWKAHEFGGFDASSRQFPPKIEAKWCTADPNRAAEWPRPGPPADCSGCHGLTGGRRGPESSRNRSCCTAGAVQERIQNISKASWSI